MILVGKGARNLSTRVSDVPEIQTRIAAVTDDTRRLVQKLDKLDNIFAILELMRPRSATNDVDKVAGVAYFVCTSGTEPTEGVPIYNGSMSSETAWGHLVRFHMLGRWQADLFFLFSLPSATWGVNTWIPKWKMLMQSLPRADGCFPKEQLRRYGAVTAYAGPTIERCELAGFGDAYPSDDNERRVRRGSITVKKEHCFEMEAHHQHPIPDGEYMLLGSSDYRYWAIGRLESTLLSSGEAFHKVSVLRMSKEEGERLRVLNLVSLDEFEVA